jgi:hypothetical protein
MVQVVDKEAEITINSQSSTTLEVPNTLAVMGQNRVGVLKIGDQDEPKVDKQVRDEVILEDGNWAKHM